MLDRIILDNAGGITLQLPGYAHWYDDCRAAAVDLVAYLDGDDPSKWEGREQDAAELDPTDEQIRNGGYKIIYLHDLPAMPGRDENYRAILYQLIFDGSKGCPPTNKEWL